MDDTTLIAAAAVVAGVAIFGLSKPVGQSLNDVTGVIPWLENVIVPGSVATNNPMTSSPAIAQGHGLPSPLANPALPFNVMTLGIFSGLFK